MKAPRHPCVPFGGYKPPFLGIADWEDSDSERPPAFRTKIGTHENENEKISSSTSS